MDINENLSSSDKNETSCFSVYNNMTSPAESGHTSDGASDDTDLTSSCPEDAAAAAAAAPAAERNGDDFPVIRIPTERSGKPDSEQVDEPDSEQQDENLEVMTPTIIVDDQDEPADQQLQQQKSADVDDVYSNALVRLRLPGSCECGSEFMATVTTPVADLVNECLDFTEAQVEAVPVDKQFYNK